MERQKDFLKRPGQYPNDGTTCRRQAVELAIVSHARAQRFVCIGEPYLPNQEKMFLRERSSYE
jgi:hypothetical protein